MTPILCVSKADMPAMMYELGRNSIDTISIAFMLSFIYFAIIIIAIIVITAIQHEIKWRYVFIFIINMIAFGIFAETALDTKNNYDFQNFAYNQPSKFIIQYYTVTTGKEYKFIAETKNNVFIKEEK